MSDSPSSQASLVVGDAFSHVTVGVADLNRTLDLWVGTFGFEIVREQAGPDPDLARMWGLAPERIRAQALVATPGMSVGRVHFVEFADPLPPVRAGAKPTDLVPKNLDLACRDLPEKYEALLAAGYTFRSKWVEYHAAGKVVREVQMHGHDAVNIVFLEILGDDFPFTPQGYAGLTTLVAINPDPDAEATFFADVFGLARMRSHLLKGPELEKMIGLPPGGMLDMRVLGGAGPHIGHCELIHYHLAESANLYPLAHPPALGTLGMTFLTNRLDEIRVRAAERGHTVTDRGTVATIFGRGELCALVSPAGLRVEVLQTE